MTPLILIPIAWTLWVVWKIIESGDYLFNAIPFSVILIWSLFFAGYFSHGQRGWRSGGNANQVIENLRVSAREPAHMVELDTMVRSKMETTYKLTSVKQVPKRQRIKRGVGTRLSITKQVRFLPLSALKVKGKNVHSQNGFSTSLLL